jgi:sigma54-dependent transcription regulator
LHHGFNFEHFDELSDALAYLLREFRRGKIGKIPDSDIMIDFTGGTKVASVVAAAITFNRSIKAQYVQTNDPWKAISYDILLASPDTGGLGVS